KLRKETIERVFADAKENHGLRYTRLRGLKKNQHQALMIFASHNLKKIGLWNRKLKELYPSVSLNTSLILRF
ncbi:MAG: transposase, partial [Erysipelotrichaceae bacterium]|nr:transposase [Erysipelotrichaceae bacterium]